MSCDQCQQGLPGAALRERYSSKWAAMVEEMGGRQGDSDPQGRENKLPLREAEQIFSFLGQSGAREGPCSLIEDRHTGFGSDRWEGWVTDDTTAERTPQGGTRALLPTWRCRSPLAGSSRRLWLACWWCSRT